MTTSRQKGSLHFPVRAGPPGEKQRLSCPDGSPSISALDALREAGEALPGCARSGQVHSRTPSFGAGFPPPLSPPSPSAGSTAPQIVSHGTEQRSRAGGGLSPQPGHEKGARPVPPRRARRALTGWRALCASRQPRRCRRVQPQRRRRGSLARGSVVSL